MLGILQIAIFGHWKGMGTVELGIWVSMIIFLTNNDLVLQSCEAATDSLVAQANLNLERTSSTVESRTKVVRTHHDLSRARYRTINTSLGSSVVAGLYLLDLGLSASSPSISLIALVRGCQELV
jgi:hypothetical protein